MLNSIKKGKNLEAEAEARATRPRPRPRPISGGLRPRPRPKIIMKKYQIMINNIRFKNCSGKINKIPEFYTIFARKCQIT